MCSDLRCACLAHKISSGESQKIKFCLLDGTGFKRDF